MFEMVEKRSEFIGTYYCVYLDDWLVFRTKNARTAALCQMGRVQFGKKSFLALRDESEARKSQQAEEAA
jgi:hypothetical protein